MQQAPWTEIGRLQQSIHVLEGEIRQLKSEVYRKAGSHEVSALSHRLDNLEHSVRETQSMVDRLSLQLSASE